MRAEPELIPLLLDSAQAVLAAVVARAGAAVEAVAAGSAEVVAAGVVLAEDAVVHAQMAHGSSATARGVRRVSTAALISR